MKKFLIGLFVLTVLAVISLSSYFSLFVHFLVLLVGIGMVYGSYKLFNIPRKNLKNAIKGRFIKKDKTVKGLDGKDYLFYGFIVLGRKLNSPVDAHINLNRICRQDNTFLFQSDRGTYEIDTKNIVLSIRSDRLGYMDLPIREFPKYMDLFTIPSKAGKEKERLCQKVRRIVEENKDKLYTGTFLPTFFWQIPKGFKIWHWYIKDGEEGLLIFDKNGNPKEIYKLQHFKADKVVLYFISFLLFFLGIFAIYTSISSLN